MPYNIEKRGDKFCVIKESDGDNMGCHDAREDAVSQIAAIEASEKKKFDGVFQSAIDDLARDTIRLAKRYTEKKKEAIEASEHKPLTVYKDADGNRHMVLVSSNGYQDREEDYISTDALKGHVDSQWTADDEWQGDNVMLFWHDGPAIGDIIHAQMEDTFLVEVARERQSGLPFIQHYTKAVWDYIEQSPEEWGASIGFGYVPEWKETTDDGPVYNRIRKFETSVLPLEYAANPYTMSGVIKMSDKRNEQLDKILPGGFGARIRAALGGEKADLETAGLEHKSIDGTKTLSKEDLATILVYAIKTIANKDETEAEPLDMRSEVIGAIDALMDVPSVNIEDVQDILEVEEPEGDEGDDPVTDEHEHTEIVIEASGLEKAISGLVAMNDQLITDQKALVEAMPTMEQLIKGLEGLGKYRAELTELKEELDGFKAEFKQRPRASQSAATKANPADDLVKEVTKDSKETVFGYPTRD